MRTIKKESIESNVLKQIGQRLLEVREKIDVKQNILAKELNISQAGLSSMEKGILKPNLEVLFHLSKKYKINIDYILHGTGEVFTKDSTPQKQEKKNLFQDFPPDQADFLDNFLTLFKKSEIFRYQAMGNYKRFLLENADLLKMEIKAKKKIKMPQSIFNI